VFSGLVDRLGRRRLWLIGLACIAITNFVVASSFKFYTNPTISGWVALIGIAAFIAAFAGTVGIVFWITISEIFPPSIRDYGNSFTNVLQWTFNLILALTFSILVDSVGIFGVFCGFSGIGVLMFILLLILLPETKTNSTSLEIIN